MWVIINTVTDLFRSESEEENTHTNIYSRDDDNFLLLFSKSSHPRREKKKSCVDFKTQVHHLK